MTAEVVAIFGFADRSPKLLNDVQSISLGSYALSADFES